MGGSEINFQDYLAALCGPGLLRQLHFQLATLESNSRNHKTKKQAICFSLLLVCHHFVMVKNVVFVAPPGLEPGISEPKSGVLPLHHGAKACAKIAKTT